MAPSFLYLEDTSEGAKKRKRQRNASGVSKGKL